MNILLINVHSSDNAGDAALTRVTIQQIHQHFPNCNLTIAIDDIESHTGEEKAVGSFYGFVKRDDGMGESGWRLFNLFWLIPASLLPLISYKLFGRTALPTTSRYLQNLLQSYFKADLIVSKPGGFLYSSGRGITLMISLYTLAYALLAGKPLYIFPQSIGPFKRNLECELVRWVLSNARVVMVREQISFRQLQECNLSHPRCWIIPDPAFAFQAAPVRDGEAWLRSVGIDPSTDKPLLGMTVINWEAQNTRYDRQREYEAACASAAQTFIERHGGKVILFPQVCGPSASQDDRIPARRIAARLQNLHDSVLMVEERLPPDLLKSIYGLMDIFIGTRMHSNIFALSQKVPVIAIGYQHKTEGIIQMLKLDRWIIDIQHISVDILKEKLDALWKEKSEVRRQLERSLPDVIQKAKRPGQIIAQDYRQDKQG